MRAIAIALVLAAGALGIVRAFDHHGADSCTPTHEARWRTHHFRVAYA